MAARSAKEGDMAVDDIQRVGVVGSGLMGHGISLAFALGGYPVVMCDLDDELLLKALQAAAATAALFVEEGLISEEQAQAAMSRLSTTTNLAELAARSDFITEAIVERSEDKRALFNKLDSLCSPQTIIVSNTSSLVLSDFGSDVKRQDRIAVTHYFAPPAIIPGVEVARGPGTSEETYEAACELMKRIRHVPIRVQKERPGYLLNRLQAALSTEAYKMWAEGVASAEDIDQGVRATFGFRMPQEGPMLHYDLAGVWRWPRDVRMRMLSRHLPGMGEEAQAKIIERYEEGTPWFGGAGGTPAEVEERDRVYLRRLKAQYWDTER
jgi:3-hydroxybutyryl-CoA dehydrogenase